MMNRYQQFRSPHAEREMSRQGTVRMLWAAGAVFFAIVCLVGAIAWISQAMAGEPYSFSLPATSDGLAGYLLEQDETAAETPAGNPYGELAAVSKAERWTLTGEGWSDTPEAERSFLVLYAANWEKAEELASNLSPSGARLIVRTGAANGRIVELEPDENRKVWRNGGLLLYYTGENEKVIQLLEGYAGEPVADGRETDPADTGLTLEDRGRLLAGWDCLGYLLICAGSAAMMAVFIVIAARTPPERR